ncbi:MAG: type IV pilus twitching motility protein PilT [Cyanothece sp. SIO1E1]|nr:type IV pilus twitching motility protein PilT [Cyanothece sp. SIO1E1]
MTESYRPPAPPSRVPPPTPPPPPPAAKPVATATTAQTLTQSATQPVQPQSRPMTTSTRAYPSPPPRQPSRAVAPPPRMPSSKGKTIGGSVTLEQLVREAYDKGFSDVHLSVGEVPRFRNRGEIDTSNYPLIDDQTFDSWLSEVLSPEEIRQFKDELDFDGAAQYDFARIRINIFGALKGPSMVLRLIPVKILTMEQLNLGPVFKDICHYHKGLILVTGPTGSGKSTTMAAMIDYINKEMAKHIITIEDPVEFVHQSQKSLIQQREVGIHTRRFDNALKASLREDPDVILVGEIRDRETVDIALKASQTGHLVMGTLHTNSAVKTIERIVGMYQPEQQEPMRLAIAESLVAVVAQGLCRTTDGKRAAFHEIMVNTDAIRDYIRRGELDSIDELIPKCSFDGMCTMNQSLYKLYQAGRITEETVLEMSPKQNEMAQILRGRV